jgi:phosphopantothenoylcysteine decarboxylase/phosphopantothenate--cysteine ligase
MGIELAIALKNRGATVWLVLGPTSLKVPDGIEVIHVSSALEMFEAVKARFASVDIAVMAAAVADYRPAHIAANKIKKTEDELSITLIKNPDILQYCGNHKTSHQLVAGFALETENEAANAQEKLHRKNADMIVMNSLNSLQAGFGTLTNKITIFEKAGQVHDIPFDTKKNLAQHIVSLIAQRMNEKG